MMLAITWLLFRLDRDRLRVPYGCPAGAGELSFGDAFCGAFPEGAGELSFVDAFYGANAGRGIRVPRARPITNPAHPYRGDGCPEGRAHSRPAARGKGLRGCW